MRDYCSGVLIPDDHCLILHTPRTEIGFFNNPLVGKLLGHRRHRTTAGYAHLADGHLVETAETIGSINAEAMIG